MIKEARATGKQASRPLQVRSSYNLEAHASEDVLCARRVEINTKFELKKKNVAGAGLVCVLSIGLCKNGSLQLGIRLVKRSRVYACFAFIHSTKLSRTKGQARFGS